MSSEGKFRLIKFGNTTSGWFNMAADDFLASNLSGEDFSGILRFYTWDPPAVSLGCHQAVNAVDLFSCQKKGWDIVFRSTGGRALLHDRDLSYSVIIPSCEKEHLQNLKWLYQTVAAAIVHSLQKFGLDAALVNPHFGALNRDPSLKAGLCLDSIVRGEVTVSGYKAGAAAQRIYKNSLLQHGSLVLEGDAGAIAEVSKLEPEMRHKAAEQIRSRAASIRGISGLKIEIDELVDVLIEAFASEFNIQCSEQALSDDEIIQIKARREKFDLSSMILAGNS